MTPGHPFPFPLARNACLGAGRTALRNDFWSRVVSDYLRFASCYKNVSLSEDKCAPWFKALQSVQSMDTQMRAEDVDDGLKKFCW